MFPLGLNRRSMRVGDRDFLTSSDNNIFFSPFYSTSLADDSAGCCDKNLAEWQSLSGMDMDSVAHWYSQTPGEELVSEIFINDTAQPMSVDLGGQVYRSLDQQPIASLMLQPFRSELLIEAADGLSADGFESGDVSAWSVAISAP